MATEEQRERWGWSLRKRWAVILLLWLLFAQTLAAARAASITFDEGPHLAVGYATLRTGDLRLQPIHIHPPLANLLAAAPLLLDPGLPDPRTIPGWEIASLSAVTDVVVWQNPHPARLALAGRLPIILLTMITASLVLRWTVDLVGPKAGLLALALYTLDPNIIAHGSLITTDMAVTAFGLSTFFVLHRYWRRQSRTRLFGVGLALGLALASKVSAVLLLPLLGAVLAIKGLHRAARLSARSEIWQSLRAWSVVVLIALAVLWLVYGFELRPLPDLTGAIPLPAATHLEVYRSLQEHYRLGHPAFLLGQISDQGWWFYFPVAFAIKTPLPILILLGIALVIFIERRGPADLTLVLYPIVYLITALLSSVDIGYRHLLPVLPFFCIFVVVELRVVNLRNPLRLAQGTRVSGFLSLIVVAMVLWLAVGVVLIHPYPLTFFNELAGGPDNGYRWLVDSNVDWGQNLWQLRDWMLAEDVDRVYYSHFSPARPEAYDVRADWLPPDPRAVPFAPFDPAPGVYAIGATTLQGVYTPDVNTFAFFRARQPDTVLGRALYVYRVPEHPEPDWVAVCYGLPLGNQQIRAGFGLHSLRVVYYDCNQSLVYLTGEQGRFVLSPEADRPDGATKVFQARDSDGRPVYTLLRSGERPSPQRIAGTLTVDGPLLFLGHEIIKADSSPAQEIILRTFWQVKQTPNRPLSLMAHLIGTDGVPITVADGLGLPVEQWQPGDIIVQRHRFSVPEDTPPGAYWLQTGAYWLDTLERWSLHLNDGTTSDRLPLDKITILD